MTLAASCKRLDHSSWPENVAGPKRVKTPAVMRNQTMQNKDKRTVLCHRLASEQAVCLYQQSTEPGNWNKSALSSEYVNPMVSCQSLVLKNDHSEAISENVHTECTLLSHYVKLCVISYWSLWVPIDTPTPRALSPYCFFGGLPYPWLRGYHDGTHKSQHQQTMERMEEQINCLHPRNER